MITKKKPPRGNRRKFFRYTYFSIVDSVAFALLNSTNFLPTRLCSLPLTLLAPLTNSPLLHSGAPLLWTSYSTSPTYSFTIVAFTQ
jgi:hypothetical protein